MTDTPDITIRGLRTPLPSGFVIGRQSQGTGRAELIPLSSLAKFVMAGGAVSPSEPNSYLGFHLKGPLRTNTKFYGARSHRNMVFPSGVVTSTALAKTAATAAASLSLVFEGIGTAATISWSPAGTVGTVTWLSTYTLTSEAFPYILVPNVPDLTLGDVSLLFAATLT